MVSATLAPAGAQTVRSLAGGSPQQRLRADVRNDIDRRVHVGTCLGVRRERPLDVERPPARRAAGLLLRRPRRPRRRAASVAGRHRGHRAARVAAAEPAAGPARRRARRVAHGRPPLRGERRGGRHRAAAARRHLPLAVGPDDGYVEPGAGASYRPRLRRPDAAARCPDGPRPGGRPVGARCVHRLSWPRLLRRPRPGGGPSQGVAARHARRRSRDRPQALARARVGDQLAHRTRPGRPARRPGARRPPAVRRASWPTGRPS